MKKSVKQLSTSHLLFQWSGVQPARVNFAKSTYFLSPLFHSPHSSSLLALQNVHGRVKNEAFEMVSDFSSPSLEIKKTK